MFLWLYSCLTYIDEVEKGYVIHNILIRLNIKHLASLFSESLDGFYLEAGSFPQGQTPNTNNNPLYNIVLFCLTKYEANNPLIKSMILHRSD